MNGRSTRAVLMLIAGITLVFLLAPIIVVIATSLDGQATAYMRFPSRDLTFAWYAAIPARLWQSLGLSLVLALVAASISTVLGGGAALGVLRGRARGNALLTAYFNMPLQIPFVVTGLVFLQFYALLGEMAGIELKGRFLGLVFAHVFFCIPYAFGAVGAMVTAELQTIENAARIAGAGEWRVFFRITAPALAPGLFSGFFFAFVASFGDVPVSVFVSQASMTTLPVEIFQILQFDYNPSTLAISSIVVLLSTALIVGFHRVVQKN